MALKIPYPQILNELSFVACASHEEFLSKMLTLKRVMDAMHRIGFAYAVRKSHGICERVCYPAVTFRNWLFGKNALDAQEKTIKDFFRIAVSKLPAFEDDADRFVGTCDFDLFFEGQQIYGGGTSYIPAFLVSYLNRLPSIALGVGAFSGDREFLLEKHEMLENGEIDVRRVPVCVVVTENGAASFGDPVTMRIVNEVHSGQAVLDVGKDLWPCLSFSDEVVDCLPTFDVSSGLFVGALMKLHAAFLKCLEEESRDFCSVYGATKSLKMDESDATKQLYPGSRTFHWQSHKRDCWAHLRLGLRYRIHFDLDFDEKKLFVGYVGPHLPTKQYH